MRIATITIGLLSALLAVAATPARACEEEPAAVKFPGLAHHALLRGDHLICLNDKNRAIAVDLMGARTIDLGSAKGRHWHGADVADGLVLVMDTDSRLLTIRLADGKTANTVDIGKERVHSYGFAGQGKAFLQRGKSVVIIELATGKTLHTIDLGEGDAPRAYNAWQKIGNRLFVVGPATTLCVIDLETGKLADRYAVDARAGISSIHVEGSLVYCMASQFSWAFRLNHLTCLDMETKKSHHVPLAADLYGTSGRMAGAPYGTAYVIDRNCIRRYTMAGECCSKFAVAGNDPILAVWRQRAVVAVRDEIRLVEINETPVPVKAAAVK